MNYQTEKMVSENSEKLSDEEKTDVESKVSDLKEALEGDEISTETIKEAMETLNTASQSFAQRLYETAAEQESNNDSNEAEDIIDAEIIDEEE